MTTPLNLETIKRAPKALLHDHLDGGLRPATVIDIAGQTRSTACRPPTPMNSRSGFAPHLTVARWSATSNRSRTLSR